MQVHMEASSWPGRNGWVHKPDIPWMDDGSRREVGWWERSLQYWPEAELDRHASYFKGMADRSAGLAGYAWGLDGDVMMAQSWSDTAATCVRIWLDCLPQMPPVGVYSGYFAVGMVSGQRAVIDTVAQGQWGEFFEGTLAFPPHEAEGEIQVALCRGETSEVLAAADQLDALIQSPDCRPGLTRMYTGMADLARAAVGHSDPDQAVQARFDAYVVMMRRRRNAFEREPTAFVDTRSLALVAMGIRSGIAFPDTNPYLPLGLIHTEIEDRDVVQR